MCLNCKNVFRMFCTAKVLLVLSKGFKMFSTFWQNWDWSLVTEFPMTQLRKLHGLDLIPRFALSSVWLSLVCINSVYEPIYCKPWFTAVTFIPQIGFKMRNVNKQTFDLPQCANLDLLWISSNLSSKLGFNCTWM